METYLNKITFNMSTKQALGTIILLILTGVFRQKQHERISTVH